MIRTKIVKEKRHTAEIKLPNVTWKMKKKFIAYIKSILVHTLDKQTFRTDLLTTLTEFHNYVRQLSNVTMNHILLRVEIEFILVVAR